MSLDAVIARLEAEKVLFSARLNRFALMKLPMARPTGGGILRVHRNHAFEGVASALSPFLAYAGIALEPALSDYDDSLTVHEGSASAELVWMDLARHARLTDDELTDWFIGRLDALRAGSAAPIIVANAPGDSTRETTVNQALAAWAGQTPGAAILDLQTIAARLGPIALDEARAAVTGTRLSDAAALESARTLAFEVLPRFFIPAIKALAVDLDNTLYAGVLGEDGPTGVQLTTGHTALQAAIASWAERGLLVAVISRNEPSDVERLFASRADFPLKSEHVATWQIGWGPKSEAIAAGAAALRVAPDSFLFIDDNLGELIETGGAVPGLRLLHAEADASLTARALTLYPGLPREADTFGGRAADLRANADRLVLAEAAGSEEEYVRALNAELTFSLDPAADRSRLAELSGKTNQFNLALKRLSEVEVGRYLADADRHVVHVRLADRLSDSGSVAAVFVRREGDTMVVDELCISCRALGRRLEDLMVAEALQRAGAELGCETVEFEYSEGARNGPARRWLEAFAGQDLPAAEGRLTLPNLSGRPQAAPVHVTWIN